MDTFDVTQRARGTGTAQPINVLIVDDDAGICNSISEILSSTGLAPTTATGGLAAINCLKKQDYELVLLDLNMPDIDGVDVMNHINNNEIETNVIVVSGELEINKAIHVMKNGAKDFIRKPYSPDELLFSIKNVLEKRALEIENQEMIEKIKESELLHKFIVHYSPDLLYMLDKDGYFTFVNKNLIKNLGYSKKEVIGKHYRNFIYAEDIDRANYFINTSILPKAIKNIELRLQCKDNKSIIHVEVRSIQVEKNFSGNYRPGRRKNTGNRGKSEHFIGTYGVVRDITEKKRSEEIIRFQHNHDLLTGLPNRNLFNDRISVLLNHAKQENKKLAVLYIDINRFKLINDSYGHMIGDKLLQSVASRLKNCTQKGDTLARIGGDEFILLIPAVDSEADVKAIANKIIHEIGHPFDHDNHEIYVTLSIGVAIYPQHGDTTEQLIKNADIAVCNSKSTSKSNISIYHDGLRNSRSNKVFIENLIRNAINDDQIEMHYQPQIDLDSGRLHAVEALVRINAPERGLVPPGTFIETAEESNLINELGDSILGNIFQEAKSWAARGINIPICINISAVQLAMDGFADYLISKIKDYNLPLDVFEIEITENVLIQNMEMTLANILKLTGQGIDIAIDDFGTGYSSLSYLDQLPLHTLKLDKSFIKKISKPSDDNTIIPAMLALSNGLKMNFIVEGVEHKSQHDYLKLLGSCISQGYYYSKPITGPKLIDFIEGYDSRRLCQ